jgi:hypothetical protein
MKGNGKMGWRTREEGKKEETPLLLVCRADVGAKPHDAKAVG